MQRDDDCFIHFIGCVGGMCQSFLSECVFFASIKVSDLVVLDFDLFLWNVSFFWSHVMGTIN